MDILGHLPTKKPKRVSLVNYRQLLFGNPPEWDEHRSFRFDFEFANGFENERASAQLVYQLPQSVVLRCRMVYRSFYVWRSAKLSLEDIDPATGLVTRFTLGSDGISDLYNAISEHRVTIDERGRFCGDFTFYNVSGNCFVRPFTGALEQLQPCQPIYHQ
ncbi:MAG: hypothetical protein EBU46_18420 [Nitrosomonadaceae bacterium]|nr:hypothetical protein [Nitrosomonadaceae bacterium]